MSERLVNILVDALPTLLKHGLTMTIPLTVISFSIAMVIAVAAAMVQFANVRGLKQLSRFYIWVVRGTPLLVQLYVIYFGLPDLLGITLPSFPTAILVFSLNEGAYCAETVRAAMESVPRGQIEAGYCVGMRYLQIMRRIVLPQALRTAFPSLSNNLISLLKDTSLAMSISVVEMFMKAKQIAGRNYEHLAIYIEVALIYLLFCTVLTKLQSMGEKKLNSYGAY